jgi:hypothetical protein
MIRRNLAAPLAAAALTLALAACSSTQQPGAAALVSGQAISTNTVAAQADEINTFLGDGAVQSQAELNRQVVGAYVQEQVLNEAAQREGVTVTATQVDDLISQAAEQSGGQAEFEKGLAAQRGVAPSQVPNFMRAVLQYQGLVAKLGTGDQQAGALKVNELIAQVTADSGVSVNPRFGAWDVQQFVVIPAPDTLSKPAPALAGAAAVG